MSNMNTDIGGRIDKYNMAVFFLQLAAYNDLVSRTAIIQEMKFFP